MGGISATEADLHRAQLDEMEADQDGEDDEEALLLLGDVEIGKARNRTSFLCSAGKEDDGGFNQLRAKKKAVGKNQKPKSSRDELDEMFGDGSGAVGGDPDLEIL